MGKSLLTPAVSGLLDTAYIGIVVAVAVIVLCVGLFVRSPWAGLLFWSGTAFGAVLGQGYALGVAGETSWFSLVTYGAIGAVLGMLAGGILADWWQGRRAVPDEPAALLPASRRELAADVRREQVDHYPVSDDTWPMLDAEAV